MTYMSPELTLIGRASGVVLGFVEGGPDDPAKPHNPDLENYDQGIQLEAEW